MRHAGVYAPGSIEWFIDAFNQKKVNIAKRLFVDIGKSDGFFRGYGKMAGFLWSQAWRSRPKGAVGAFSLCIAHTQKTLLYRRFDEAVRFL
jgi:hypothetical protein